MQVAQCVCEIPSFVKHAKAIKNESEGCHFPLGLMSRFVTFLSAILTQDNGDFPLTDRFDHWNYMLLQTAWIYFLFWVKLWLPTRPLALIQNAVWYIVPLSPQSKLVGGLVFVCAKPHFIWGAHSPTFSGEAAILFLVVVQSCFPITERLRGYTTDCTICYRTPPKRTRRTTQQINQIHSSVPDFNLFSMFHMVNYIHSFKISECRCWQTELC